MKINRHIKINHDDYIFSSFIAKETNIKAKAKAKRFVRSDAPFLLICGPDGSGKTHLASAIKNRLCELSELKSLDVDGVNASSDILKRQRNEENEELIYQQFFESLLLYDLIIIEHADSLFFPILNSNVGSNFQRWISKFKCSVTELKKKIIFICNTLPLNCKTDSITLDFPTQHEMSLIYDRYMHYADNFILSSYDRERILNKRLEAQGNLSIL